jgi:hypothetical protein
MPIMHKVLSLLIFKYQLVLLPLLIIWKNEQGGNSTTARQEALNIH